MHGSATLASAALLVAGSLAANVSRRQAGGAPCKDVHIFLARGNNEPYPGRQGALAGSICSGLPSCDYEDIQFWNPLESPYCGSVEEGAANGIKQLNAYNERCPDAKLVLSGYSQGGQVAGDILGGGGGTFFQDCVQKTNGPLGADTPAAKKIVAALIFGDTRHTAGQSYNYLDGAGANGLFPRPGNQLAELNKYAGVLRNYCDATDPICAGGDVVENHLNYFDIYSESAGEWVREMVAKAGDSPSTTTTTSAEESTTSTTTSSKTTSTSTSTSESSSQAPSSSTASSAETEPSSSSSESPSETSTSDASSTTAAEETESSSEPTEGSDAPTTSETQGSTSTSGEASASSTDDAGSGASVQTSASLAAVVAFIGLMAL